MGGGCCNLGSEQDFKEASGLISTRRLGNFSFNIHGKNYTEGIFVGEGCKRTPGWFTDKTASYVAIKRAEFWGTRVTGLQKIWEVLKKAVEEQDARKN